jgi:hypothetical protein
MKNVNRMRNIKKTREKDTKNIARIFDYFEVQNENIFILRSKGLIL